MPDPLDLSPEVGPGTESPSGRIENPVIAAIGELAARLPEAGSSQDGKIKVINDGESGETRVVTWDDSEFNGSLTESTLLIQRDLKRGAVTTIKKEIATILDNGAFTGPDVQILYPKSGSSLRFSSIGILWQVIKAKRLTSRPKEAKR